MIMSYKSIFSNTINRQQTGGIIMTELSRFQKDVEVAATALEMRAENEDAKEEAIHLYRKFRPAVERLILEDDWEKIEKLYENEWFGEQELEVFLKLAEEWRRPAALMGLLHLKKANYGFKEKEFEL